MTFAIIRVLVGVGIVVGIIISASRKNTQRERELEAAGVAEDEKKVNLEEVFNSYYQMIGMDGFAISQLAPYGRVMIYGKVFQACCEDCVVEKGNSIEVIGVNERTLIVKRVEGEDFSEDEAVQDENDE